MTQAHAGRSADASAHRDAPAGGALQIDTEDTFTTREFAAESIGWLLLSLVVVAACWEPSAAAR